MTKRNRRQVINKMNKKKRYLNHLLLLKMIVNNLTKVVICKKSKLIKMNIVK